MNGGRLKARDPTCKRSEGSWKMGKGCACRGVGGERPGWRAKPKPNLGVGGVVSEGAGKSLKEANTKENSGKIEYLHKEADLRAKSATFRERGL